MADEKQNEKKPKKEGGVLQNKQLLNALASGFDPEVAGWIDRLIAKIPQNSPLRKPIVDRVLAVAKSLLESQAEKKGPLIAVASEKVTDYLDFGRAGLTGTGPKGVKRKTTTEVDPVGWMNRFFQHAEKRLAEAENPEEEKKRLDEEFEARKAIFDLIKAAEEAARATGVDEPEAPATEPIDWNAKWRATKKRLYGTKKKPGPIPKAREKAHRTDVRVAWTLRDMNRRLEGWLEERGA